MDSFGGGKVKSDKVPHNNFREGFVIGYQLIHGVAVAIPAAPAGPAPTADTSSFLLGIREGLRQAGAIIKKTG